jgi:hypothetical protein
LFIQESNVQIEMDFIEDIRLGLVAELQQLGHDPPASTGNPRNDAHRVCIEHWNAHARRIPVHPRAVHWSPELRARVASLPTAIQAGVAVVEREIQAGDDMTARLSRQLGKRKLKNDLMLNDWGIQHLHLDPVNRAAGTSEILFALVRSDAAYFIDVRHHGAWTDGDLVEIIHSNWPATIEAFRSNALRLMHPLTDEQRRNLRNKHGNSAIQMQDGTVYQAIGGGLVGSGANIRAVVWGDWTLETAKLVEDFLRGQTEWLGELVESAYGERRDPLRLHLHQLARDHAMVIIEDATRPAAFRVPIQQPPRVTFDQTASVGR